MLVQSGSVSQARSASLVQTPAAVASPGVGSVQVPAVVVQQMTAADFPQVDRAAQRKAVSSASPKQPARRSAMR